MDVNEWVIFVLLLITIMGLMKIICMATRFHSRELFTSKYLEQFNNWLKTYKGNSSNDELYIWLTQNVKRIQLELGDTGVAAKYIPPFSNYVLTSYQIITNTLPLIKIGKANELEVNACRDALNRHIGFLKSEKRKYFLKLLNPFQWIFEGIKMIIKFPIYLFYWRDLYGSRRIKEIENKKCFKIISFISTLIYIIAVIIKIIGALMKLVIDWPEFWKIITQMIK